jgi:hypothetical protein
LCKLSLQTHILAFQSFDEASLVRSEGAAGTAGAHAGTRQAQHQQRVARGASAGGGKEEDEDEA